MSYIEEAIQYFQRRLTLPVNAGGVGKKSKQRKMYKIALKVLKEAEKERWGDNE